MKDINISTLIKVLHHLQETGAETVQITGTLICVSDGNTVIATSEKQI
jgi:hypothetical protein